MEADSDHGKVKSELDVPEGPFLNLNHSMIFKTTASFVESL